MCVLCDGSRMSKQVSLKKRREMIHVPKNEMKCEEIFLADILLSFLECFKQNNKKFSCVIFYLFDEVFVLDHYFIPSVCSVSPSIDVFLILMYITSSYLVF